MTQVGLTTAAVTWKDLKRSLPSTIDHDALEEAISDAKKLYAGKTHWTGRTLLEHCFELLRELSVYQPDRDLVIACLLHQVPELHAWSFEEIERRYGSAVRTMVGEAHVLSHLTTHNRRVSIERLRLNVFRVTSDVRVLLLTLCDQLLTLKHIADLPKAEQRRVCNDALYLYAPVAARLGIYALKHAFEDVAFPVLYGVDHERVTEQLASLRSKHGLFLEKSAQDVREALLEQGLDAEVTGREKHPYSVFLKMRRKSLNHIEDIPDLFAIRVVVPTEAACYQALGLLHRLGHPVQNRFKDYIAFPKPNGYQSLHTTVFGLPGVPQGIMTEVQIRTPEMHREAGIGIAAHWRYKETGDLTGVSGKMLVEKALTQEHDEVTRAERIVDHIFVLTPKGDVVELPDGATPLDFAFQVHTTIGLSFKAARVNGVVVPLDHGLENGDVVEIVRHKDPKPSPRWVTLLKTASAKNRLRKFLADKEHPRLLEEGKAILNRELEKLRLPELDSSLSAIRKINGKTVPITDREDLLMQVGSGSLSVTTLLERMGVLKEAAPPAVRFVPGAKRVPRVDGGVPMPCHIAKCCKPEAAKEPAIVGVISRGGDVKIHLRTCKLLKNVNPERRVKASWTDAVSRRAKR